MMADEIRDARLQLGMSYREFAAAIGLKGRDAPRHVRRLESGERQLSVDNQRRLDEVIATHNGKEN